jgi:hypothetical protein
VQVRVVQRAKELELELIFLEERYESLGNFCRTVAEPRGAPAARKTVPNRQELVLTENACS